MLINNSNILDHHKSRSVFIHRGSEHKSRYLNNFAIKQELINSSLMKRNRVPALTRFRCVAIIRVRLRSIVHIVCLFTISRNIKQGYKQDCYNTALPTDTLYKGADYDIK